MPDNLTAKQQDYSIFLPAISGFYATFIGKQRNENYVDPARFPQGLDNLEQLNWLNSQQSLFPYRWSLYSGGHANLDLNKQDWSEDMVRNRESETFMLGDSGGFQIAKGLWEGDWRAGSGCARAQNKRATVLKWLDTIADYSMILDIPTWVIHDPKAAQAAGFSTTDKSLALEQAVDATKFNNEYFIKHRLGVANGGTRFLNVLQGDGHQSADVWYDTMKHYCDPQVWPGRHFDGWAMGGQNMCDVHLILKRLIVLKYDNLLQEGVHDWMHFLGTSKLEWAVLLTVLQRAVRRHVNPNFTISFDCASPFLATANGQVYVENVYPEMGKWSYRMAPSADDKRYATDHRPWQDAVVADQIHHTWTNSPVSDLLTMHDICHYRPGDLNKNGREGRTSWDSFSYMLLMSHNVWMHITAVQEANRRFDAGSRPRMMENRGPGAERFEDLVEAIFAAPTKQESLDIIDYYSKYWRQIKGTRGFTGESALNANAQAQKHFEISGSLRNEKLKKTQARPDVSHNLFEEV